MKQPDFIQIPTQLLLDRTLMPLDRIVYGYVYWMHKLKDGSCTASNETLAEMAQTTARSVGKCLERLEERGYIRRTFEDEVSRHRSGIECLVAYGHQDVPPVQTDGGATSKRTGGLRPNGRQNKSSKNNSNKEEVTNVTSKSGDEKEPRVDRRDPEVTELVEYFETAMDLRMPRGIYQRRAAKTLISRYGLPVAKRAVDAVVAARDYKFAPRILSLEDLRDKWNDLAEFYRKHNKPQEGGRGAVRV